MRVAVERCIGSADGRALVEVRTPVGMVTALWRGDKTAPLGEHWVEWELGGEFSWGLNCVQALAPGPRVCQGEHGVVFRGRLRLDNAERGQLFAYLELDGAMIGLGDIEGLPDGMAGSWVELRVDPGCVEIYPYLV